MAATGTPTPNLGLRIPQGTDPASVDDINYNSNLLDTKLGAVGNTSVQDQIDSLNSNEAKIITQTSSRYVKHFMFQNVQSITIDLIREQTNQYFCMVEIVNANQGVLVNLEANGQKKSYGTKSVNTSLSGTTLTITPDGGGTFWGITHVTLTASYEIL